MISTTYFPLQGITKCCYIEFEGAADGISAGSRCFAEYDFNFSRY